MGHGPQDSEKKLHAEQSDTLLTRDTWVDIARKTLIVILVSITVWVGCELLRALVEFGSEWLFETAETYGSTHALLGPGIILSVMLIGGVARGLLLLMPSWKDAEGDGIDKGLVKYYQTYRGNADDATVRYEQPTFLHAVRKMVMTTLTIGTGGSGGLEAPGVYLGETIAAGWSKAFKRPSADELRLYQLAGVAAAIGTLLAAPLTAALFAAELLYAGRIIYRTLAYCLIAALVGYALNNQVLGFGGLFDAPEHARLFVWQEVLLVFIVAVGFSAPAAIALGPVFRVAERFFARLPVVARAATGALITGVIGVAMWMVLGLHLGHILGISEKTLNDIITGTGQVILQTWWVLVLAVIAKTFATAATIKSGGSAGMLIPAMYMGGLVGAAAYYLLPEIGLYPGPSVAVFVATGMAAALTSIAGVPLASIAFVIEVFGAEYSPAACFACAVCFTASRRFSLYMQPTGGGPDETR